MLGTTSLATLWKNNFWGQGMAAHDTQHQSYRPLTVMTYRLNHAIHGLDTFGFHLVNVAMHVVVTLLFTRAAARLLDPLEPWLVCAAGLLFATHPVHVEAVAGLVGRAEVLSGVFFCLALLAYINACHSVAQQTTAWLLACIACTGLSVLSKEQGITVVAVCFA